MLSGVAIATLLSLPALTLIAVSVFMPPRRIQLTCSHPYTKVVSYVHLRPPWPALPCQTMTKGFCWRIV